MTLISSFIVKEVWAEKFYRLLWEAMDQTLTFAKKVEFLVPFL